MQKIAIVGCEWLAIANLLFEFKKIAFSSWFFCRIMVK